MGSDQADFCLSVKYTLPCCGEQVVLGTNTKVGPLFGTGWRFAEDVVHFQLDAIQKKHSCARSAAYGG